ncbi:MAG: CvpA family protein [Flavisolibacter sp.]|jgi:uncharacterized protein YkwD
MNYLDIILLIVIGLAIWAGWKKGFILGSINLAVWIGSMATGFIFYQYAGSLLSRFFPGLGVWTLPLAFLLCIILSRIILAFIFNTILRRTPEDVHAHGANRFLGIIPGIINGIIYATIIAAVLMSIPLMNELSSRTRESKLVNSLAVNIGWIDDKLAPIFDEAVKKSLTRTTVEPESDETVNLNFTVKDASPRADLEARMLDLVNTERQKAGLQPLKADPELVPVARAHSQDMFSRGYFSHYTPEGKDPFDRMKASGIKYYSAGENLALGQTLRICHEGLMHSPGHRANILNPSYGRVGIGILDGGSYGLMISQEFRN